MANQRMQEDNIKYVVSAETAKAQQEIHKLSQETKDLAKEERARRQAMIELEAQGKKNTTEYKNLQKEAKELSDKIKDNNKQIGDLTKKVDINGMSMVQLKKRAKELQTQLDNTNQALNPEEWNRTNQAMIKVKTRISELSQQSQIMKGQLQGTTQVAEQQSATLNKLSGYWEKIKLAAKGFILLKLASYIQDISNEGVELAETSDGVKRAFDRMDDGTILSKLRAATKGTVSDLSLMQAAVQAKDFRIPLQDLGKYLQFAQLKAQQTGESVDYLTDSIVKGLGRKSLLILDNLGLSGSEINEEIAKTGDLMSAVSSIVDKQLAAAGSEYVSATDKAQASTIRFTNAQLKLGQVLLPLKQSWDDTYTDMRIGLLDLIGWMFKHKEVIGLVTTSLLAYIAVEKLQAASTEKNIALRILENGYEKAKALYLGITRAAMLLYTAATEALAGRTMNASIAMAMFNKVTKFNPIGLLVAGIVAAVGAFTLFRSKTDIATSGMKELNTNLATQKAKLSEVFSELRKTNPGTAERIRLVKQLKESYPDLLANYNLETASLKEITKAQNAANIALTNRIVTEMKAKTASAFVEKNISTQMEKIEYLLSESQREMGDMAFGKFKASLTKVLNDSSSQFSSFWKTFGKYFNATIGSDTIASFQDTFRSLRADQKNMADGLKDINSKYDPFISNVKTSLKLSDEEMKQEVEANSLLKKLEKQKQQVQDTWKEDTKENIALKNKEIERIDAQIKKYTELGKTTDKSDKNAVALKRLEASNDAQVNEIRLAGREKQQSEYEIESQVLKQEESYYNKRISLLQKFSESAKKADKRAEYSKQVVDAKTKLMDIEVQKEKQNITELQRLRDADLAKEDEVSKAIQINLSDRLATQQISQEEYNALMLSADTASAETRLAIQQRYFNDVSDLEIKNAKLKEDTVNAANKSVTDSEQAAAAARVKAMQYLNNLVKSFKEEFKLTTVDEDLEQQMKVLDAAYQARKDMAEKSNLDTTELDQAYNRAKEQLELEHQQKIASIRDQYGLSTEQERYQLQLDNLKGALDQQLLTQEEYEKAVKNLKRDSYKKQFDYYSGLFSGAVNALQQAEMDNIDAKYDGEIEAAKGNAEEVERLENEKEKKKLEVQKKYADINFAIKASQIVADTAVSIMKAYADLGPIAGTVAAALLGITGVAQLLSANAERQKVKNMTVNGSSSSKSSGARVATGRESGGYVDVEREQDGKKFNAKYDPDKRGYVDRPTVIVGEGPAGQSKEWVAGNAAVSNPTVAPILDMIDSSQRAGTIRTLDLNAAMKARMAGYATGGSISTSGSGTPAPANAGGSLSPKSVEALTDAINNLVNNGVPASVVLSDLERKQQMLNRSREIGSKR